MRDELFGTGHDVDPVALVRAWLPHVRAEVAAGTPLTRMTRLLSGLFHGRPGARAVRRHLSEHAHRGGVEVVEDALALLDCAAPRAA
jgi:tRNA-dihydrouridine synthase A